MRTRALPLILCLPLAFGSGCADPAVMQEKTRAFESGLLSSIQDGQTTRQEVLLRYGTPSASFEGGRILTFDFLVDDPSGEWRRVESSPLSGWQYIRGRTSSLVLVFGPDDRLVRHSLVTGRETAPDDAKPASVPPS